MIARASARFFATSGSYPGSSASCSAGSPQIPSGGGCIAPPMRPCPSTRMSINALRSSVSDRARCSSGLSNGGFAGLMIRLRAPLSVVIAQVASDTWLLMSRSPASMSVHEEVTRAAVTVLMPVFNNLVLFDQHKERNTIDTIVPDLAESWGWSEDGKELTFKLRHGIKWHDGKPFTAADVKCTWDLLQGKTPEKLRLNPRRAWYRNLDEVTTKGDDEVTFHLMRPQPYLLVLLASGVSPVYPCHVSPAQMRQHPIGTGPFKFVEYKPNEAVRLTRNPDYWKPGRPYLDGLEFPIVASVATRNLMFIADNVDMT